jgi:hypothetical protein
MSFGRFNLETQIKTLISVNRTPYKIYEKGKSIPVQYDGVNHKKQTNEKKEMKKQRLGLN